MAYIGRQQDGFGVRSRFIYTATGGQTTFNTDDSGNALSYADGAYVDVYLNGVLLDPADYTDTSLTSIVLASGATASDILEVIVYDVFSVFSGTFTNGITASEATVTGDLIISDKIVHSGDLNTSIRFPGTDRVTIETAGSERMRVNSTGVGIGTNSPAEALHVYHATANVNAIIESGDANAYLAFKDNSTSSNAHVFLGASGDNMTFFSGGASERMRLMSDGTLLIAQTADDSGVAGHIFNTNGSVFHVRDGGLPFVINRLTDDGAVAEFRQDGNTDGQINTKSGDIAIGTGDTGLRFNDNLNALQPFNMSTNAFINNTVDLGTSGATFNEAYIQGGAYIGGTGSANLLDDYEEGTWTPSYGFTTTGATITYDKATGEYVKIGRQVIARFQIRTDAFSGGSGTAVLGGFPFTASTNASGTGTAQRAGGLLVNYANGFTTEAPQTGYVNDGNDYAILLSSASSDARDDLNNTLGPSNFTSGTNTNFLMGTVFFTV